MGQGGCAGPEGVVPVAIDKYLTREVYWQFPREVATMRSDQLRLDDQLCFALYSATNAVMRTYRPLLDAIGLTYPQYLVLMALWERDDRSMSDLADRLGLPAHGLTPIVRRLANLGLLVRRRDSRDRRVVCLTLTKAGADLEAGAAHAQTAVVCRTGLPPDRLALLRLQVRELVDTMTAPPAADATAFPSTPVERMDSSA